MSADDYDILERYAGTGKNISVHVYYVIPIDGYRENSMKGIVEKITPANTYGYPQHPVGTIVLIQKETNVPLVKPDGIYPFGHWRSIKVF